jgi:DNA invertase Pin-like site-specific DNA recombinase
MVTRIDWPARSIGHQQDIVRAVKAKGAALEAPEQPIDTPTAAGKCFLDMLGVFAGFETNLRKERQVEGMRSMATRAACLRCAILITDLHAGPGGTDFRRCVSFGVT